MADNRLYLWLKSGSFIIYVWIIIRIEKLWVWQITGYFNNINVYPKTLNGIPVPHFFSHSSLVLKEINMAFVSWFPSLCVFLSSMLSTVAWGLGFDGGVEIFGSSLHISQDKSQWLAWNTLRWLVKTNDFLFTVTLREQFLRSQLLLFPRLHRT